MHLKLEELQRVAKKTIKEEQSHTAIRDEFFRVFGPPVMVSRNFERVAEAVNEQLDLFESTGREVQRGAVKTSVLVEAATSNSAVVRKVAARLLPSKMAERLLNDPASSVRCAAAQRLSYSQIREAVRNFPADDQLRTIARQKKLNEAGLPKPEVNDEPFDMYGEEPLGDAVKQRPGVDFSDSWYERLAHKLCSDYGGNLEGNWEEILATRVVASHYSTTGVKMDREKLLKAIYDCIEAREDAVLGEGSLKSLSKRLLRESHLEETSAMPVIEFQTDPVRELLESNFSTAEYVDAAEKLFNIKKSTVPSGIKKYRLGEGTHKETQVPVNGRIPNGNITTTVENALDRYVDSWNKRQALAGEPYRLSWGPHGSSFDMVGFNLTLK
jgi:hypothetical protein